MKSLLRLIILIGAIYLSIVLNNLYIDSLFNTFNMMSVSVLYFNRVALALLLYFCIDLLIIVRQFTTINFINRIFLVYFIWLLGLLFGRIMNISQYNVYDHFNFSSYLPLWKNHFNNPLIQFYVIGNIVVFIPLGLYLRYYKDTLLSFLFLMLIIISLETIQGITNLGYFDVDDILLNGIGGLIGIIFMHLYKKIFRMKYVNLF